LFVLKVPLPDVVAMQCRQPSLEGTGEIKLRRLVKEALRMRPSRIVVGEVRQEESLDLLIALNSGLPVSPQTVPKASADVRRSPTRTNTKAAGQRRSRAHYAEQAEARTIPGLQADSSAAYRR
jgi:Flp pilus assembly CpaF family ATPase